MISFLKPTGVVAGSGSLLKKGKKEALLHNLPHGIRFHLMKPLITPLIADPWTDYALLDSGHGRKLERYGKVIVDRPEPQALWNPSLDQASWEKAAAMTLGYPRASQALAVAVRGAEVQHTSSAQGLRRLFSNAVAARDSNIPEGSVSYGRELALLLRNVNRKLLGLSEACP